MWQYQGVQAGNEVNLRVGAGHGDGGAVADAFTGRIDEVAYYQKAPELAEIEQHFKAF